MGRRAHLVLTTHAQRRTEESSSEPAMWKHRAPHRQGSRDPRGQGAAGGGGSLGVDDGARFERGVERGHARCRVPA